jgi:hypothetical protein
MGFQGTGSSESIAGFLDLEAVLSADFADDGLIRSSQQNQLTAEALRCEEGILN